MIFMSETAYTSPDAGKLIPFDSLREGCVTIMDKTLRRLNPKD